MSTFRRALHKLTGVKLKMSTAYYHPETDGSSERSNKTVIQSIRFHVECNQQGWVRALPRIRFNIMNTVNKSTGFYPFQLCMGRSPQIIPPLLSIPEQPEHPKAIQQEPCWSCECGPNELNILPNMAELIERWRACNLTKLGDVFSTVSIVIFQIWQSLATYLMHLRLRVIGNQVVSICEK
jgi:hypothetical protein